MRVEPQSNHLVITVTSNYFVAHGFLPNQSGPSGRCTDTDAALEIVAEFLRSYTRKETRSEIGDE